MNSIKIENLKNVCRFKINKKRSCEFFKKLFMNTNKFSRIKNCSWIQKDSWRTLGQLIAECQKKKQLAMSDGVYPKHCLPSETLGEGPSPSIFRVSLSVSGTRQTTQFL